LADKVDLHVMGEPKNLFWMREQIAQSRRSDEIYPLITSLPSFF